VSTVPPPRRTRAFPFSAVVGQDDARLALVLAAVDPGIGGVLLRGDKGSAKSTLARGLAALLPDGAPFVELPIGATEDRVVGGLDVGAALGGGEARLRPGLLAAADGGVLYVDEVNLLPDHLVDVLLDAAASGVHRVERDGVSHEHPARFVLVGSMNPEEGELRPQLLDRFGLSVDVKAPTDPALRAEVVRRRLAFEAGRNSTGEDGCLAERLATARPARLPDQVIEFAARLALSVGAEGMRADLVLCRAAAARAGWDGRHDATVEDVERVAPMALAHRRRRRPFDPPSLPPDELADALARARDDAGEPPPSTSDDVRGRWSDLAAEALARAASPVAVEPPPRPAARTETGPTVRGVVVGDRAPGPDGPRGVAVAATLRSTVARGATAVVAEDVREPVRRCAPTRCVILAVDTSGSMGTRQRAEAAAGAVLGLLADAYRSRHRVALVTFRGTGAEVVLAPTASVEVARARLGDLPTGGATPLAEGLTTALETARRAAAAGDEPFVVVLTDGRATAGPDALDRALRAAEEVAGAGIPAAVLDAEDGPARLGCARRVAAALNAPCLDLGQVSAAAVEGAVRQLLAPGAP
jgi:magnesium chelatase subunit D